jgi:hypothetical protein
MRKRLALAGLALVSLAAPARAGVTVHTDKAAVDRLAAQAGVQLPDIDQQLQTELEHLFQTYRLHDYLRSFADAQSFTTRGLGVDYGSTIGLVEVGIAANVAVNGNRALTERDSRTQPVAGVATNITAMAGLNLGFLGLRPVTLFGNFFRKKGSYRELAAELDNYGAHLQLKFLASRKESLWSGFVRWGGIAITTGFDRARMKLSLNQTYSRKFPVSSGGRDVAQVDLESQGTFAMESRSWSVPLEVTTNLRFLYMLTAYGGVGFDFQFGGGSEMDANLTGRMTGTVAGQPGAPIDLGSADVVATEQAKPSASQLRGILGLQANVWFVKVFTQLNVVPNPFVASVAVGARLVW